MENFQENLQEQVLWADFSYVQEKVNGLPDTESKVSSMLSLKTVRGGPSVCW